MIMKWFLLVTLSVAALASTAIAQKESAASLREVRGQTLMSNELPRADLTFGNEFRYVGGQRVNLYGMAAAEQHIFVVAGSSGVVERFYWVQFEHRLPTDKHTYDYKLNGTTDIGGLRFIYDVKSWPDYAANQMEDPDSDGAAVARLLDEHNLVFAKKTVRVRMFYLPTFDRRTELMIIYGEALPDGSAVPLSEGGVDLDKESPDSAHLFLEHARKDLGILKKFPHFADLPAATQNKSNPSRSLLFVAVCTRQGCVGGSRFHVID
jgi:hypothetical protein